MSAHQHHKQLVDQLLPLGKRLCLIKYDSQIQVVWDSMGYGHMQEEDGLGRGESRRLLGSVDVGVYLPCDVSLNQSRCSSLSLRSCAARREASLRGRWYVHKEIERSGNHKVVIVLEMLCCIIALAPSI